MSSDRAINQADDFHGPTEPLPPRRINEIVHGRRSVTADTALRIGQALGMTPEFWLNLQSMYDLDVARNSIELGEIERLFSA